MGGNPVTVRGTIVETPPEQSFGAGWNNSLVPSIGRVLMLSTALGSGESISVQFLLGVMQTGRFSFFVNIDASHDQSPENGEMGKPANPAHTQQQQAVIGNQIYRSPAVRRDVGVRLPGRSERRTEATES
ncbi:MAG TPA: hypothetical protein VFZ40_17315 [Pyrinomonadaceae bacterium]